MLTLSLFIGITGYGIYALGLLHVLYPLTIALWITLTMVFYLVFYSSRDPELAEGESRSKQVGEQKYSKLEIVILTLLIITSLVNLIGALGPELAFDALWYHLTLAKIYETSHGIFFIPGNLLYYSAMPRLGEMYYTTSLLFGNEILAKVIHFSFGILTLCATYPLAKKFLSRSYALLAVLVMSTNLVFAWESTTAYVDLIRTFFEVSALLSFTTWVEKGNQKYLLLTGALIGFAISVKLLAIGSLTVFGLFVIAQTTRRREPRYMRGVAISDNVTMKQFSNLIIDLFALCSLPFALVLPWLLFSFQHTGSFLYPFFPKVFDVEAGSSINPFIFFKDTWTLLTHADDPLSPVYVIVLPIIVFEICSVISNKCERSHWDFSIASLFRNDKKISPLPYALSTILFLYCLLTFLYWYTAPHIGQARYILPYLPAWSIISALAISALSKKWLQNVLIGTVIFVSLLNTGYRMIANARYIPVIIGQETKQEFLAKHLNFSYGDFYDTDGYFKTHMKPTDKVLLIGFHNLYYIDFPYIHSSWRKPTDTFTYVATQQTDLPSEFTNWKLIYENTLTGVKLYHQ